jgi:uncharacterized protein YaeQ
MKYTFNFIEGDKRVLERRQGESERHIILKALGLLLYYDRNPGIELRVSPDKRDYRPDVVAFDTKGEISLWIDCGKISLKKLDDLSRQLAAEIVILKATRPEMEAFARQAAKKVRRYERIRFLGFDPEFVPALIAQLRHINSVQWRKTSDTLTVTLNGAAHTSALWQIEPSTEASGAEAA